VLRPRPRQDDRRLSSEGVTPAGGFRSVTPISGRSSQPGRGKKPIREAAGLVLATSRSRRAAPARERFVAASLLREFEPQRDSPADDDERAHLPSPGCRISSPRIAPGACRARFEIRPRGFAARGCPSRGRRKTRAPRRASGAEQYATTSMQSRRRALATPHKTASRKARVDADPHMKRRRRERRMAAAESELPSGMPVSSAQRATDTVRATSKAASSP